MLIEIDALPGRVYTGEMRLENMSPAAEKVRLYLEDWDKLPDGNDVSLQAGTGDRSCSDWIAVSGKTTELPGNSRDIVKYSIDVPLNASGSYWTSIMLEGVEMPDSRDNAEKTMQIMIKTKFRYAVRVFVNVMKDRHPDGAISGVTINKNSESGSRYRAIVRFKNSGNTLLKPGGFVEIRNMDGVTIGRTEIPSKYYVVPGREREITTVFDGSFPAGEYIALAVLDIGTDRLIAGETHFVAD